MFRVVVAPKARKSSKKMPTHYKEKIIEITEVLGRNPVPSELHDVTKLSGKYDSYRIRIGSIRVSYVVIWDNKEVHISEIEWRGGAYK